MTGVNMNKDQLKGRMKKATGKAKAVAGKVLRKPTLAARGRLQQVAGTAQAAYGDLKSTAKKKVAAARRSATKKGIILEKKVRKQARKQVKKARRSR
jgi:uncharacterized protein YjbJ (UPF0337 family)